MNYRYFGVLILLFLLLLQGCGFKFDSFYDYKSVKPKEQISALSWYDVEDENAAQIILPDELADISGICFTPDDRLFCDGDDSSGIFQIDPYNGKILKVFYVGGGKKKKSDRIKSSFEDLTIVGDRFFILNSHGIINECKEGKDSEYVLFTSYKTKLNKYNNVEGICFDPPTNSLLLACKDDPGEGYEKHKTIYPFYLATMTLADTPRFALPSNKIKKNTLDGEFRPSGIARYNPAGTFFVIAYHGHIIVEVSDKGEIINQKDLPEALHKQPEGIAFSRDNTLYISDEARGDHPRLTAFKLIKK